MNEENSKNVNQNNPKILKTRERISNAALKIFSKEGLNGSRMDQIADEANISKSNIFYYFDSKEALYLYVLENVLKEWLLPFGEISADKDPKIALKAYLQAKYKLSKENPEASKLFAMEIIQGAPYLMRILKGPLKSLVQEKVSVINIWIAHKKIKPISAIHFIFHIWAVTQHYADFSTQIEAVSNSSLKNKKFEKEALETSLQLFVDSLII